MIQGRQGGRPVCTVRCVRGQHNVEGLDDSYGSMTVMASVCYKEQKNVIEIDR